MKATEDDPHTRSDTKRLARIHASVLLIGLLLAGAGLSGPLIAQGAEPDGISWRALRSGAVVLIRHATAPGIGDPQGFRLGDCGTQRNLDATGRAEATRIGEAFRAHDVPVAKVLSSQWCRTRETADLAFPGLVKDEPVFNSFFDDVANDATQTAAARTLLLAWKGPGVLVVVTHQVNITALTAIYPGSGEGVVVAPGADALKVVGRFTAAR